MACGYSACRVGPVLCFGKAIAVWRGCLAFGCLLVDMEWRVQMRGVGGEER